MIISFVCILNSSDIILPYQEATIKAKHIAHKFHKLMKSNVKKHLKKGGIVEAAKFCINRSTDTIKRFNA